ncbi:MAG: class I SAM-dependent methyltransferase [Nitrospirales bacterium]|nr:class I SAM-dependent methyltransferase [Nitrospirales bacterium]MBA3966589.1 class I SAM-dependent methyltransferase [Nitrospirales bacterium]
MMERVLEPEIMDDPGQVQAYAEADFQEENQGFVDNFLRLYEDLDGPHVVDVGCGPGDIAIRLARSHPTCRITGIDASIPMITWAEQAVKQAGLAHRIEFLSQRFQDVSLATPADAVMSNSLAHHVPNPLRFWYEIKKLIKPGGLVLVMDLLRPDSPEEAQALVDQYAAHEPERLRQDFFHSLLAAFTEDEVAAHLAELNLSRLMVDVPDNRHWIVYGRVY